MSADNFYIIRKHPLGGFAAVMGFASYDDDLEVRPGHDRQFFTVDEAWEWANKEYSEYGVSIHPEVNYKIVTDD